MTLGKFDDELFFQLKFTFMKFGKQLIDLLFLHGYFIYRLGLLYYYFINSELY